MHNVTLEECFSLPKDQKETQKKQKNGYGKVLNKEIATDSVILVGFTRPTTGSTELRSTGLFLLPNFFPFFVFWLTSVRNQVFEEHSPRKRSSYE